MTENEKKDTKESKKEPETKEPDETTEATTENVNTLIEKTLAEEEKERQTRSEIKIARIALGLSLLSVVCLYLIAYNNVITDPSSIFGVIFGGIIGGIIGGIMIYFIVYNAGIVSSIVSGGLIGSIAGGVYGGVDGSIAGFIIGGISGTISNRIIWNTTHDIKEETHPVLITLLSIVFFLPFVTILAPLSRYHNQNQIKRDTIISEAHLQIKVLEDCVEVRLPTEHESEHSYLEKVLFVNYSWGMVEEKAWKDIVDPCRDGDKYWYKVKLPFPEKKTNTADLFLVFKHVWENYETTKEISFPDPNSPNSL